MKKFLVIIALTLLAAACGTGNDKTSSSKNNSANMPIATAASTSADSAKGLAVMARYDCYICHATDKKITGPAFIDVAKKYAGSDTAVAYLANKIINGGGGVWGTIPMSQHVNLSEPDAELVVKYVLSLKTK